MLLLSFPASQPVLLLAAQEAQVSQPLKDWLHRRAELMSCCLSCEQAAQVFLTRLKHHVLLADKRSAVHTAMLPWSLLTCDLCICGLVFALIVSEHPSSTIAYSLGGTLSHGV